jgi:hypothetical protein
MKKIISYSILFFLVGLPLVAAAHSLGLVRFAAADFPAFITCFTVVGLLAILTTDYAPRTPPPMSKRAKRVPPPVAAESPAPAAWTLHTLSV